MGRKPKYALELPNLGSCHSSDLFFMTRECMTLTIFRHIRYPLWCVTDDLIWILQYSVADGSTGNILDVVLHSSATTELLVLQTPRTRTVSRSQFPDISHILLIMFKRAHIFSRDPETAHNQIGYGLSSHMAECSFDCLGGAGWTWPVNNQQFCCPSRVFPSKNRELFVFL